MPLFLAGLLVRGNALPPEIVEEALQRQVITGGALDSSLLELGSLDEATMAGYLARASGLPLAPLERLLTPDVKLRRVLPLRLADRHGLVPFAQEERTVHMACAYPADAALLDEMGFLLSQRIEAHIAPEFRIRLAIEKLYGHPASTRMHELSRRCDTSQGDPRTAANLSGALPAEGPGNDPPDWTVTEALSRLEEATDRHLAIDTVLRFARRAFSFVAVFGVFGGRAVGWDARGPDVGTGRLLEQVNLPLDTHSVLSTVVRTGGRYLGPIPDEEGNRLLLGRIGRRFPESAFVQPVLIGERTVAVLYADNGDEPVSLPRAAEVMAVVQALGASLERMIRSRKAAATAQATARSAHVDTVVERVEVQPVQTHVPTPIEGAPSPEPPPVTGEPAALSAPVVVVESPAIVQPDPVPQAPRERRTPGGQGRRTLDGAARAVEALLASRSAEEKAAVLASLPELGEPVADVLTALLPGPIRFGGDGQILGGPVVEALATLGDLAIPALHRVASSPERAVRYWTAVLLGRSRQQLALSTLQMLAGDSDPQVAAASRAALERLESDSRG